MEWFIKYFDKNNRGGYISDIEWAEEHLWVNSSRQMIALTKRKEGKTQLTQGRVYKIILASSKAEKIGNRIAIQYESLMENPDPRSRSYLTNNLSEAMDFIDAIKSEIKQTDQEEVKS